MRNTVLAANITRIYNQMKKQRTHTICNKAVTGPLIDSVYKRTVAHSQAANVYSFYLEFATFQKHQPEKPFDKTRSLSKL